MNTEIFEPKKSNQLLVNFPPDIHIPNYLIKSVENIKWDVFIGRWSSVILKFYSPVSPSLDQIIFTDIIEKKIAGISNMDIIDIAPSGDIISIKSLIDCMIDSIDFGVRDWSIDTPSLITMVVQPQTVIFKK